MRFGALGANAALNFMYSRNATTAPSGAVQNRLSRTLQYNIAAQPKTMKIQATRPVYQNSVSSISFTIASYAAARVSG
jgi:hypothetical protein